MIPYQTLKYLVSNKIKDARTLLKNRRFPAAVYIAGYAVELALKYKICRAFQFNQGFPETRQEISNYLAQINKSNVTPLTINISDIRNHDLNKLLFYSGAEFLIRTDFLTEWAIVKQWNPEIRYKKLRILRKTAENYLQASRKIIRKIN